MYYKWQTYQLIMVIYLMTIAIVAFRNRKLAGYFLSKLVETSVRKFVWSHPNEKWPYYYYESTDQIKMAASNYDFSGTKKSAIGTEDIIYFKGSSVRRSPGSNDLDG